jgi:hypothetical protein
MCSLRWGCRAKDTAATNTGASLRGAHAILDTLPECDAAFAESAIGKFRREHKCQMPMRARNTGDLHVRCPIAGRESPQLN